MEEDRDFDRFIELFKFGNPADIWRYGTTTKKLHVARSFQNYGPLRRNKELFLVWSMF
jgi:hypothetical protein